MGDTGPDLDMVEICVITCLFSFSLYFLLSADELILRYITLANEHVLSTATTSAQPGTMAATYSSTAMAATPSTSTMPPAPSTRITGADYFGAGSNDLEAAVNDFGDTTAELESLFKGAGHSETLRGDPGLENGDITLTLRGHGAGAAESEQAFVAGQAAQQNQPSLSRRAKLADTLQLDDLAASDSDEGDEGLPAVLSMESARTAGKASNGVLSSNSARLQSTNNTPLHSSDNAELMDEVVRELMKSADSHLHLTGHVQGAFYDA